MEFIRVGIIRDNWLAGILRLTAQSSIYHTTSAELKINAWLVLRYLSRKFALFKIGIKRKNICLTSRMTLEMRNEERNKERRNKKMKK